MDKEVQKVKFKMDHDYWSWDEDDYSIEEVTTKLNYAKTRLEDFRKKYKNDQVMLNIIEPTLKFEVNYWEMELDYLQNK